jgi:transcriptional regulator with XRE-family HTH domain
MRRKRDPNTAYRRAFGLRLRDLRYHAEISQEGLALKTGIARSYLGGIERGERNPSLDHIVMLATGLGVQPRELLPEL